MAHNKSFSTQNLVNTFPTWSNIRMDEQSLGFQFVNSFGSHFDKIYKLQADISENLFINTSKIDDIDVYYEFKLPGTYEFVKEDDDDTEFLYTVPVVSGVIGSNYYNVSVSEKNDVETFWYNIAPTRLSLETTSNQSHILASGYVDQSPFSIVLSSGIIEVPNKLTISFSGGTSYLKLTENNVENVGQIFIEGETRQGLPVTERIVFLMDDTKTTNNDFSYIVSSGIKIYGIDDAAATYFTITSARFNQQDYKTAYDLYSSKYINQTEAYWALGSGLDTNIKTLDLKTHIVEDLELRLQGFVDRDIILQQELLDLADNNIVPNDLCVQDKSDLIWIVDNSKLYLYEATLPYPDTSGLLGKQYDASSIIETNKNYIVLNDEIEIDYIWKNANTGFIAHRVYAEKPDGNKYNIVNGVFDTYDTSNNSWVYGEPTTRHIRARDTFVLDQRGDYIFTLEVKYTDETTSIDKRIVSVVYKNPIAEFNLSEININENIIGVDIDSEGKLWVLGVSGTRYEINRHYDKMMVNFSKKILYFREPYDSVRVY